MVLIWGPEQWSFQVDTFDFQRHFFFCEASWKAREWKLLPAGCPSLALSLRGTPSCGRPTRLPSWGVTEWARASTPSSPGWLPCPAFVSGASDHALVVPMALPAPVASGPPCKGPMAWKEAEGLKKLLSEKRLVYLRGRRKSHNSVMTKLQRPPGLNL